jgi:hypothetical protein
MNTAPCYATTYLQGLGECPARPAAELQTGDLLVWNHGYISEVLEVRPKGPGSVVLVTRDLKGDTYEQTKRRSTLVAVALSIEPSQHRKGAACRIEFPSMEVQS